MEDFKSYSNKVFKRIAPINNAGMKRINVDVHIVSDSHVGFGVVARSIDGKLIWAAVKRIEAT